MRTIKPVKAGDELFNDYGEIPRADLLRRYGYVTDNYAQYDVVELPLTLICQAAGLNDAEPENQPQVTFSSAACQQFPHADISCSLSSLMIWRY
jgi:SET domain-containing protein 6